MALSSQQTLDQVCKQHNLVWKRNPTNGDTIDGWIDEIPIQAKFCSKNFAIKVKTYPITTQKSAGIHYQNYHVNDPFSYIIVEVGGTHDEPDKYRGQFCVIPKSTLVEQGVLESETCLGKHCMYICPPDYVREHWSKKYWNNWDNFVKET